MQQQIRVTVTWLFALLVALGLSQHGHAANIAERDDRNPPVQVGILLFDGVQIIDFAGPYEVFGHAEFNVVTVSPDGVAVTTEMGLKVTPDYSFANAPAFDVLLVPGGDIRAAAANPAIQRFVRERSAAAGTVLSVCTGSHILGSAGVLDGLKATTFHDALAGFAQAHPKVQVVRDVRWTDNGKVITSAGLSSGIDAALHVVARLRGMEAARTAAMQLEYDWQPDGGFVRTRMADRYLPSFKPDSHWPADLKAQQAFSFGDERHWRRRFDIRSAAAPAVLLKAMARRVDEMNVWKRIEGEYAWLSETEGKRVKMTFSTHARADKGAGYAVEVRIDVI